MIFGAHTPEPFGRRRAAMVARLLGFVVFALFSGCLVSAAALGATSPETGGAASEVPQTSLAGSEGSGAPPSGEAKAGSGSTSGEASAQSGGAAGGGGPP